MRTNTNITQRPGTPRSYHWCGNCRTSLSRVTPQVWSGCLRVAQEMNRSDDRSIAGGSFMSLMPVTHVALYVYRPALIELRTDEALMLYGLAQSGDQFVAEELELLKPDSGVITKQLEPGVYGFKASNPVLMSTIPGVSVITKAGNGATASESLAAIRAAGDDGGKEPSPTPPPPPPTRAFAALAKDVWESHTSSFMVAAG